MSSGPESGINNGTMGVQGTFEQMNLETIAKNNENRLTKQMIHNRFCDHQLGKEYKFSTDTNNRIYTQNGINKVDFVIDQNGIFRIGAGHSFLADGKSVYAAGTIKISSKGYIRRIDNLSGHYQPSVNETISYLNYMNNRGYMKPNTWVIIYSFNSNKSRYITKSTIVYNGPYKYLNRRLNNEL